MLTKNLLKRGASLLASVALASTIFTGTALAESEKLEQPVLAPRVKSIIEADGYQFIDLNGNGTLDVYEDWRLASAYSCTVFMVVAAVSTLLSSRISSMPMP